MEPPEGRAQQSALLTAVPVTIVLVDISFLAYFNSVEIALVLQPNAVAVSV